LAEGNLREAKVNYDQGFVRSPIDGRLNHLYVDPGEFVNRGQKVADIVDISTLRINVNVPEMDVRYLKVGQKARIVVDAYPERHWIGAVDLVSFKADPTTRTFKVRLVVDNSDLSIRPGMIARVAFIKRLIENALTVPLFSIIDKGGERIVFVEENGTAHARTVSIGVIEGDVVQITDGLKSGENLIVKNQHEVEEGMKVTVE
jgi:membrane fusion protein (multidrug efflux system)